MSTLDKTERDRLLEILKDPTFQKACMMVQAKYQPASGIDVNIAAIPGISGLEMLGLQEMRNAGVMLFTGELAKLIFPPKQREQIDPRSERAQLDWLSLESEKE